jgi:hypothetical protein
MGEISTSGKNLLRQFAKHPRLYTLRSDGNIRTTLGMLVKRGYLTVIRLPELDLPPRLDGSAWRPEVYENDVVRAYAITPRGTDLLASLKLLP